MDKLSDSLCTNNKGCHIAVKCINHLLYADDIVLICPSVKSLNSVLKTCSHYARSHDILFNASKSKCLCVLPNCCNITRIPHAYLDGVLLTFVKSHTYLGVVLNYLANDGDDIRRQMKTFYASANVLIRNFYNCSFAVKLYLFKAYCSAMYCAHLWSVFNKKSMNEIRVSYNNAFRILLGIRCRISISQTFVNNCIMTFDSKQRTARSRFYCRLNESNNILIKSVLSFDVFQKSALCKRVLADCF